jgi:hypothetical protein
MNGKKSMFGPSRGRGLYSLHHTPKGRAFHFFGSPVKGNGTKNGGFRNRYSLQVIDCKD